MLILGCSSGTFHLELVEEPRIADGDVRVEGAGLVLQEGGGLEGVVLDEVDALDEQEDREAEGDDKAHQKDDRLVEQVSGSGDQKQ